MYAETTGTSYGWNATAFFIALTMGCFLARFETGNIAFGIIGISIGAATCASLHRQILGGVQSFPWLFSGLAAVIAFGFYNGPGSDYRSLYYGAAGGVAIFLSYYLASRKDHAAVIISTGVLFSFYAALLILMPFKGVHPDAFNHYFPNTSRNGIGAVLIFSQIFYSAARYIRDGRPPLVTPVATLLLCVLLYGRSGTLFSYTLVVVSCLAAVRSQKLLAVAALVVSTVVMAIVLSPAVTNSMLATPDVVAHQSSVRPGDDLALAAPEDQPNPGVSEWRRGLESIRPTMIKEYLVSLQPVDWLLGGRLAASPAISEYNMNPHNSFIRGHAYFGMPYLLLIGAILLHALYEGVRRRQWFLPALMLTFAARSFFDTSGLFDLFDIGFFFAYFSLVGIPVRSAEGTIKSAILGGT